MTPRTFDIDKYGYDSPYFRQQLAGFNALRDQYLQRSLVSTGMIRSEQQTYTDNATLQQVARPAQDWTDNELLGAAQFWGLSYEEASQAPREQLAQYVTQMRDQARPSEAESSLFLNELSALGMFGVGAAQGATRMLRNLPLVGESLGRIKALQRTNVYFEQLEEGLRASTPDDGWTQGALTAANVAGQITSLIAPGNVAWNVAGRVGGGLAAVAPAVGRFSPIVRGAAQGLASTWLLEGGNPDVKGANAALVYGLGAGLGAAAPVAVAAWRRLSPLVDRARGKVASAYIPNQTMLGPEWVKPFGPELPVQYGFEPTINQVDDIIIPQRVAGLEQTATFEGGQLAPLPEGFETLPEPLRAEIQQFFAVPQSVRSANPTATGVAVDNFQRVLQEAQRRAGMTPQQLKYLDALLERSGQPTGLSLAGDMAAPEAAAGLPARPQGFTTFQADAMAVGMNKASTVMNAPDMPELIAQPMLDDITVARASVSSNPGGSNIIQAVAEPGAVAQAATGEGQFIRYATPKGTNRLDAIVSDQQITNDMVKQYEAHGFYAGQQATTQNGLVGKILEIKRGTVTLQVDNTAMPVKVKLNEVLPSTQSPGAMEVPEMWDQFMDYAQNRAGAATRELVGTPLLEQMDVVMLDNMPTYIDDFLDTMNIARKGDRARITKYFNQRYVEAYKAMAPVEIGAAEGLTQQVTGLLDNYGSAQMLGRLDEMAASKGMVISPKADGGYELIDMVAKQRGEIAEMPFENLEAVEGWLATAQRDMPDLSPTLAVPGEVSPMQLLEATQPPNLNGRIEQGIADELADLATNEGDELIGMIGAQAQALRESGRLGALQNLYINGFTNLSSMRRLFSTLDEFAVQGELKSLTPFQDYQKVSVAVTARHNFEEPLQEAAAQIMQNIRVANRRSGLWSQMYLIEDPVQRVATARARGLNEKEIAAFDELSAYWHRLFAETGLSPERELRNYLPQLQKMQSMNDYTQMEVWKVTPESDAFFKHVRSGNINVRELDPETLINTYVKTLSWDKYVAGPFEEVASKWNAIRREVPELEPASQIVQNWLHTIRYGYQPGPDALLDWAHGMSQILIGPGVTRHQARQLVNTGLNASYSSMMGYSLDVVARDLQQIWLAAPRTGPKLFGVMKRYMTEGAATRQAMWDQAVADNMVSLVHPRAMSPGASRGLESAAFLPAEELAAGQVTRRQAAIGRVLGTIEDMIPNALKSEKLRPGYLYGRQGEITRMLVGTAGKENAAEAIMRYRKSTNLGTGPEALRDLLTEAKADTFHPAVRREFSRLVAMGADDEAAKFIGRQMADASQFKYGGGEGPIANRSVSGRVFAQLGSYPLYYVQYLEEIARYGTPAAKAATLGTVGLVSAAFYGASKATGWNFNRLNPFTGLGFTGGPALERTIEAAKAGSAYVREFTGQNPDGPSPPGLGDVLSGVASQFNPAQGLIETASGVGLAMDSPSPASALIRLGITGQQGVGPDLGLEAQQWLQPQTDGTLQQMMRPMSGPVRMDSLGTTSIPQQQVTNIDPSMRSTPDISRYQAARELPPGAVLQQLGVTDTTRVRYNNGGLVYDTPNGGTHSLSQAGQLLQPGQTWEQYESSILDRELTDFNNTAVVRDLSVLDPEMGQRLELLRIALKQEGLPVQIAETRRPQSRQEYLFAQGRSDTVPGNQVTWTLTSAHGNNRAIDLIINKDMSGRDPGYRRLHELARSFGLVPIGGNDPGHISMTDSSMNATPQYSGGGTRAPKSFGPGTGGQF